MKKIIWTIVILFLVGITFNLSRQSESETIKIGVVSPLTGAKSQVGEGLREAIKLAEKDFGKTKNKYEFIFEDSGSNPAKSASAVKKLISIDKVNAFISITSQDSNIVSKSAEISGIPHIAIANDEKVAEGEYNFIHWTPADIQAKLFVEELKKINVKKVAVFIETNDSSLATVESFKKYLKNSEIEIVWSESFNKGETDFRTMIKKMGEKKPDLIMLQAFSPSIEILAKQLKEQKNSVPISSITNIGVAKDLKVFEGVWYVSGGQPSTEFNNKFKAQTGYDSTIGAHYGYEATKIYLSVFESTKNISGKTIKNKIKEFDFKKFDSITGLSGIDADGKFLSPATIVIVKDGKNVERK